MTRDFSGDDIVTVLANVGSFSVVNVNGSHVKLHWDPPESHDTERRVVVVPRHDRVRLGTLRDIADQSGAQNFDAFCRWIDEHR